jgi:antitoxin component of RelBE/YafQ-DinJ toxin-antitoxin module
MSNWKDKMHDELDQLVDDMVKEEAMTVIRNLENSVADAISIFDHNISDTADQYADGVHKEDILQAIMEFQCSAELRLKHRISDHIKGLS